MTGHGLQQTASHLYSILYEGNEAPWMADAACRNALVPDDWFPPKSQPGLEAKKVCRTQCPVIGKCLDFSLNFPEPLAGIWAGLGENERARRRKKMKRAR